MIPPNNLLAHVCNPIVCAKVPENSSELLFEQNVSCHIRLNAHRNITKKNKVRKEVAEIVDASDGCTWLVQLACFVKLPMKLIESLCKSNNHFSHLLVHYLICV